MSALTKVILFSTSLFLLLLPACAQDRTQAEPPRTQAADEQPAAEGSDSGAVLEVTEERPTAVAPSPEPIEEATTAPTATPTTAVTQTATVTQTAEAPAPQATKTPQAAAATAVTEATPEATEATEEAPTPIAESVTGVVLGNSGTTADLVQRGITIDVTGLASNYAWLVVPLSDTEVDPLPRHILLTFDDDDPEQMLAENGRRLYLFPVRPYLALYTTDGQSDVDEQVARLGELIDTARERTSGADLPPGDWMPLLPLLEDGRLQTWEQFADVDFASGHGVRFLSDYTGVPTYFYQGLSEGDRYYLSLFWPLVGEEVPELEALDALAASFMIGERDE